MSERKFATIRKIKSLAPIKDADRIEIAQVDGWKVVVQKGLHKVGDLVVYFEIDSLLPEIPEFEFLRKSSYVKEGNSVNGAGFRLKTIKLKGQISQGLIVPIRELTDYLLADPGNPYNDPRPTDVSYIEEGDDVTDMLFVKKYEKPVPANLAGKIRGNFPSFIPKTDQERIQNFIGDFNEKYSDHEWEVSLKLDGSSMTVYYYAPEDRFGVCSRNLDLKETEDNAFWQVARKLNLETKMRSISSASVPPQSFAIQGELIGPGVQGNREKLSELDFFVFDIYDIDRREYLVSDARGRNCRIMSLNHVPVYSIEKFAYTEADDFLKLAEFGYGDGKSLNNPVREGLVFKSVNDPSVSFKAISNKYLMEGGE